MKCLSTLAQYVMGHPLDKLGLTWKFGKENINFFFSQDVLKPEKIRLMDFP